LPPSALTFPSDELSTLQAKLQEYMDNGAQLGWLIDPDGYRPGQPVQVYDRPDTLLPHFTMDFTLIWT